MFAELAKRSAGQFSPEQLEALEDEAYTRSVREQLFYLLPYYLRFWFYLSRLSVWMRTFFLGESFGECKSAKNASDWITQAHADCLWLERCLISSGAELPVHLCDIASAAEKRKFEEVQVQLIGKTPLLSRLDYLYQAPRLRWSYFRRIRKIRFLYLRQALPASQVLGF